VTAPETDLDLLALALLRRVARTGSVARAADELQLAAPTANARLRNLENQLGATLLDRTSTGSTPTEVGILVVEWAEDVLDAAERLAAGVGALTADTRRLRIAASHTVAEHLLPSWLAGFRRRFPDVTPELHVTNSASVVQRVKDEEAVVGFIESRRAPRELTSLIVADDDLVIVVDPAHPWALDGRARVAAELVSEPLVVRERDSATREVLDQALRRVGVRLDQPVIELGSSASVRNAVVGGQAPAVLSRLAVANDLSDGRLCEIPITDLDLGRQLRAVWLKRRQQPEVVTDLLDQIVRERRSRQAATTD
jgi:DNA-binding transcriptional LysR family regulator